MKIVVVEPHKAAYEKEIVHKLENLQEIVGGYIEAIYNNDGTALICNEEGKLQRLEGNRRFGGDILAGTFFICGVSGENFCSLTDEQTKRYLDIFAEPEDITPEQVLDSIQARVIPFENLESFLSVFGM